MINEEEVFENNLEDDNDEEVFDFSEVEVSDFSPLPNGTYRFVVETYTDKAITKPGGKIPIGTKGTSWMFSCIEEPYVNRKVFSTQWHHLSTMGWMKALAIATGEYTEEELSSSVNISELRDRIQGSEVGLKLSIRKSAQYGDSNNVVKFVSTSDLGESDDDDI